MSSPRARTATIAFVLDNEAVQALDAPGHRKHRAMVARVAAVAARGRRRQGAAFLFVPTAVRVEAGIDRRSPGSAGLGLFRVHDLPLTADRADRCAQLGVGVAASVPDVTVAQAAEELALGGARVTVLTSDRTDVPPLVAGSLRFRDVSVVPI